MHRVEVAQQHAMKSLMNNNADLAQKAIDCSDEAHRIVEKESRCNNESNVTVRDCHLSLYIRPRRVSCDGFQCQTTEDRAGHHVSILAIMAWFLDVSRSL